MKPSLSRQKALLAFAEFRARQQGQRWTDTRVQVYEALLGAGAPVTAYQLVEQLAVKPTSVYRSLDALMGLGLIAKIESLNTFIACQHPDHDHQHVFLVCKRCGMIDEIADHGISRKITQDAASKGFKAQRQILEVHGDCQDCSV